MLLFHLHFYYIPLPLLLYSNFNLHFHISPIFSRNLRLRGAFINCLHKTSKKVKFTY